MGHVAVVGSFNVDHVWRCQNLPRAGETLSGAYDSGPGGKGFNQAVAARRAGADTTFLCALGQDAGAQLARALAEADAIDLRDQRSDAPTGSAGIFVDAQGRNCIVLGPGANASLHAQFVADNDASLRSACVLLTQLETGPAPVLAALRQARGAGVTTILNPAPANAQVTRDMLLLVDVLTPNETEFAALVDTHLADAIEANAVAVAGSERLHALCRELLPHGTVAITLGDAGCFVSHAAGALRGDAAAWLRIAAEPIQAIDTTGAGDAFNGALAASLAAGAGHPFARHVRFASRYAALSAERAGAALAMPRLAELQARFGAD